MFKNILLILLVLLTPQSSLYALEFRYTPSDGISDFGILRNANEDDKKAHQEYMIGSAPIVLVADSYNRELMERAFLRKIDAESDQLQTKYFVEAHCEEENVDLEGSLLSSNRELFSFLREIALVYSARGTTYGPNADKFEQRMAKVFDKALSGPLKRCWQLNKVEKEVDKIKDDLTKAKQEESKAWNYWGDKNSECAELKKGHEKLALENKDLAKDNSYKNKLLSEAVNAMNDLEKSEADLKAKVTHQEKVALEVAKEAIELEERNEELQEQSDRSRKEKAQVVERFEKEIETVGAFANQRHAQASSAVAALRTEISPLRRALSPLRRQAAAQEVELEEKDAEIAQLKQMLIDRQLHQKVHSRQEKTQRRLKALQRAQQQK